MKQELKHFGILGMRWGRRKGPSANSSGGSRKFTPKSLTKNMDGRKTNKLFGKRNRKEIGKKIVNMLMTPERSKTKWTDMDPKEKKRTLAVSAAALAVVGGIMYADIATRGF